MNHNKTGVYLTVNKLQLLLCYKYSLPPTLGLVLSLTLLIDVTEEVYHIIYRLAKLMII
jgi:hypothetical protein